MGYPLIKSQKDMNIYCNNGGDPLLYQRPNMPSIFGDTPQTENSQQFPNMDNLNKAYNQLMMEIRNNQNQPNDSVRVQNEVVKDWIGELDSKVGDLDKGCLEELEGNMEYMELNQSLQGMVQAELMSFVKDKLNRRKDVIDCVQKQMDMIGDITKKKKQEERDNYSEMTDYMQNYSHLTFDEYKKLKNGVKVETKVIKSNKK